MLFSFFRRHMKNGSCESALFICGLILLVSELWKQYTLTFSVGSGYYDWWYFPFQLCSVPMYLLILLPFFRKSHVKRIFFTFLMDFSLLGGICAFLDTSGMHYPLSALTVHSYCWHVFLILLGLACGISGIADYTWQGFRRSVFLFVICAGIAEALNLIIGRAADINMFYISPYYEMHQVILSDITRQWGNSVRILLYLAAIPAGAWMLHLIWRRFRLFP